MLPALLAHLQEALNKRHLVYCVRVMSVGCTTPILEWSEEEEQENKEEEEKDGGGR
jgi:hypothetical protein